MRHDDLDAVCTISDAVHAQFSETRTTYAERLNLYPEGCFVFTLGGKIAGYLISHPWRRSHPPKLNEQLERIPNDADTFYLHDVALLPPTRNLGAGTAALQLVIELTRSSGLKEITLTAVSGADSFWEAQGFEYLRDPIDSSKRSPYGAGTYLMRQEISR